MYRSILIPLDGTPFGEQALPVAREVARRSGATLHLVHVHSPGTAWTPLEGMMPGAVAARPVSEVADHAYLEALRTGLMGDGGIQADIRVLEGPVGRSVAESARAAEVDLVVMSTHARTGMSRLWHHDVAGYLTRNLHVPVLAVPVHEPAAPPPASLGRMLVPLGGRPQNAEVLDNVAAFCGAFAGEATLLRVVEPPTEVGYTLLGQEGHVNHYLLQDLEASARDYLEETAARLRAQGLSVQVAVTAGASVADAILEFAAAGGFDVIAVGTHGLGTVRHLFASSVVEGVVAEARIPVLLQHEQGTGMEGAYEDRIRSGMGWHAAPEAPLAAPPLA
jgi:nucleotide-binding universal stress UspA family protein